MAEFSLHGLKSKSIFKYTRQKHANMATQLEGAINNLDKNYRVFSFTIRKATFTYGF